LLFSKTTHWIQMRIRAFFALRLKAKRDFPRKSAAVTSSKVYDFLFVFLPMSFIMCAVRRIFFHT